MAKFLGLIALLTYLLCLTPLSLAGELLQKSSISQISAAKTHESLVFAKTSFSAKRQEVVTVNPSVLLSNSEFTLTLFDREPLKVRTEKIIQRPGFIEWEGRFLDVSSGKSTGIANPKTGARISGEDADYVRSLTGAISLRIASWDVDTTTGEVRPAWERSGPALSLSGDDTELHPVIEFNAYKTVEGTFSVDSHGKTYILRSLETDRSAHILIEVDPNISNFGRLDGGYNLNEPNDQAELDRLKRYNDHLESLGIDRGTLKSDGERATEFYEYLRNQGVRKLDELHPDFQLLRNQGYDPLNIPVKGQKGNGQ